MNWIIDLALVITFDNILDETLNFLFKIIIVIGIVFLNKTDSFLLAPNLRGIVALQHNIFIYIFRRYIQFLELLSKSTDLFWRVMLQLF